MVEMTEKYQFRISIVQEHGRNDQKSVSFPFRYRSNMVEMTKKCQFRVSIMHALGGND